MSSTLYIDYLDKLKMSFQMAVTPVCYGIVQLHHYIFFFLVLVFVGVMYMLFNIVKVYSSSYLLGEEYRLTLTGSATYPLHLYAMVQGGVQRMINHNTQLEIIWTICPSVILWCIAAPSFALLYAMDEFIDPALCLTVIGHQWYWTYEYGAFTSLSVYTEGWFKNTYSVLQTDSFMVEDSDLQVGDLRLLQTDAPLVLPEETHIRLLVSADDVIHSWAVPSFGVKMDAVPGRVNQVALYTKMQGHFFGQCSELCGVNHAYMPVEVVVLDSMYYYNLIMVYFGKHPSMLH